MFKVKKIIIGAIFLILLFNGLSLAQEATDTTKALETLQDNINIVWTMRCRLFSIFYAGGLCNG